MKTILFIVVTALTLTSATFGTSNNNLIEKSVYICNGPKSTKYHLKKECTGLRNCSTEIEEISESKAIDKGRTLCGYED